MSSKYADIILPLKVNQLFTYEIPEHLSNSIKIGQRVIVPLKEKKLLTGIVRNIHNTIPVYSVKKIINIIDNEIIINEQQFRLWEWISAYYMCSIGEVYLASLPSGLILESETVIVAGEKFSEFQPNSDKEKEILNIISTKGFIDIKVLKKLLGKSNFKKIINNYVKNKILNIEPFIKNETKKYIEFVNFKNQNLCEEELDAIFKSLKKSKKQAELIYTFIHLNNGKFTNVVPIKKNVLLEKAHSKESHLKALVDKGIFVIEQKEESEEIRMPRYFSKYLIPLSNNQKKFISDIKKLLNEKIPLLVRNIYNDEEKFTLLLNLIDEYLAKEMQILYLVPEIHYADKIKQNFEKILGNYVIPYHNDISENNRSKLYLNLCRNNLKECVIIGARSAVFLPFNKLGLIIIDDEHEQSYKNQSVPYFNTRDVAIVLSKIYNADVLLLSNTPLLESIYNVKVNKYNEIFYNCDKKKADNVKVEIIDFKKEKNKGNVKLNYYTDIVINEIKETIKRNLQVVIFINRRGYSPYLECEECIWVAKCKNCDVNLVYHKNSRNLICHYCEYSIDIPHSCSLCGSAKLKIKGVGTQRVEDEITLLIENANIVRIDYDALKDKKKRSETTEKIKSNEIQIITGTQMIKKIVDFKNVGLIVIPEIDTLLNFADFRANEKVFQILETFRNKLTTSDTTTKILIQTNRPNHPVLKYFELNNINSFYEYLLNERKIFFYPPFSRIIKIVIFHKDRNKVLHIAEQLKNELLEINSLVILGPQFHRIEKIKNNFIIELFLKIPKGTESSNIRINIYDKVTNFFMIPDYKNVKYYVDVDPL
ncbi:MAG: primosomal protein N' [Bacteroidales bacterium]|nr:primosomal protein N' [Bacteroidales bacterium]